MRKGSYICTYTNLKFYPLDPRREEVKTEDIAQALSLMCRANGHFSHFFSVAQHSIYCAEEAKSRGLSRRIQLACLMHDASEAYISDITRPVKSLLKEYLEIEEALQGFIYSCYGLTDLSEEELALVKEIDDAMLNYEMKHLMNGYTVNDLELTQDYDLSFKMMDQTRDEFIELADNLMGF